MQLTVLTLSALILTMLTWIGWIGGCRLTALVDRRIKESYGWLVWIVMKRSQGWQVDWGGEERLEKYKLTLINHNS